MTRHYKPSKISELRQQSAESATPRGGGRPLPLRPRSRVAQWKRAGPITQRSVDRNHALLLYGRARDTDSRNMRTLPGAIGDVNAIHAGRSHNYMESAITVIRRFAKLHPGRRFSDPEPLSPGVLLSPPSQSPGLSSSAQHTAHHSPRDTTSVLVTRGAPTGEGEGPGPPWDLKTLYFQGFIR